jgi:hypothetical protein
MIQFGMREIGIVAIIVLSIIAASMELPETGRTTNVRFEKVIREIEREPITRAPDPKLDIRSTLEQMGTAIVPVAIQVSLLPRDLLDREMMERQIRGQLESKLGNGWTVEVICYAGWCNIKLKHAAGEVWIDANQGSATKLIYLH